MGQAEIMKVLEKLDKKTWITTTEVMNICKANRSSTSSTLKKMRDFNEIESRKSKITKNRLELEHRLTDKGRL